MQEGRAGKPGHERRVFYRVPHPVAAPSEHGISPMRAKQDAYTLEAPGDHGPAASEVNPFFARIAAEQRGERESKRNGEARISGIKDRRMDHHLRILQQGLAAVAV